MSEIFLADFSPIGIVLFILYTIYSIAKANKKAKEKQAKKQGRDISQRQVPQNNIPNQPGKNIDDILRELEERIEGKAPNKTTPTVSEQELTQSTSSEKTVAEYKQERHSDMQKHHVNEDELNDGKFDDIDHRLLHLEGFETNAHPQSEGGRYSPADLRQAVIWDAILNRPDF